MKTRNLPGTFQKCEIGFYLGRSDSDLDLTTVSAHQGIIRVNDLDGIVETTVLGQGVEKVLGQLIVLASREQLANTALLFNTVDGGVVKELSQLGILFNNTLDILQVGLDTFQSLLLGGCRVQSGGVTTINAVEGERDLRNG